MDQQGRRRLPGLEPGELDQPHRHTGGANVATADGAAHFLKERTDPAVILALLTRAGGEVIRDQDWR